MLAGVRAEAEEYLIDQIGGYESVVFLAPMGAHGAIAIEAWQVVAQWDLQTDEDDVVHAVQYGVPEGDPEHTQTWFSRSKWHRLNFLPEPHQHWSFLPSFAFN